ncbi:MAG: TldD/PmbA family protein [Planctomycetota bacterium]
MSELLDLARFALRETLRSGAESADVSIARGRSLQVEIRESAVASCDRHDGVSACVRCFVRGGCGVHMCHGIERGDLAHASRAAVSAARAAGADPDFKSLPAPEPAGIVPDLHDERLAEMTARGAAGLARSSVERALGVAGDANVSGALAFLSSEGAFVNSLGVEAEECATSASTEMMCVIRRGGLTGSYCEFDVGRRVEDVDLESVGEAAAKGAVRYLGPRKMRGGQMPCVFGPLAASALVGSVACAASAEPIQRGRSYLRGKLAHRVAPSILTIEDDGRYPAGIHSSSRDGEGTPRKPILIVEKGTFARELHNSYTAGKAKREGVRSTGHGSQLGAIAPTNLRPRVGTRPARALIGEIDDGLYVESLILEPNPVTGDISATVDWAMKIEGGELAYPVTGVAISGNVLEILDGLEEVSSDYREEPGSVMPTLRFGRIQVAGTA